VSGTEGSQLRCGGEGSLEIGRGGTFSSLGGGQEKKTSRGFIHLWVFSTCGESGGKKTWPENTQTDCKISAH